MSCHSYDCVDRKRTGPKTQSRAGSLPSLVLKFGEARQLTLSRQMPHAAAVFSRTELLVQRQTNIVSCLPASLCICLQHLTRRLDTIAIFINSHLNQQFSTGSTQLADGIVLQAVQTLAMCSEKQSLAPCRELACCLVQSDFHRDVCHR